MLGVDYISQHVWQAYRAERREEAWRTYAADCLRSISESTARFAGGSYMQTKWTDLLNPPKEELRTPDEVVQSMVEKLRAF